MAESYHLATNLSDLDTYLALARPPNAGLDTETTSLDTRRARLVGMSLSHTPGTGIYIPIGHKLGENLPLAPVIKRLEAWFGTEVRAVMYNAKYDRNVLQATTGWNPAKFLDALELVYLDNPDRKRKGLKLIAAEEFGVHMEQFEDIFTPEEIKAEVFDLSTKTPARCRRYACADADMTLRIYNKFQQIEVENIFAVRVDTALVDIVRKIEHNGGLELNPEYITEQLRVLDYREDALREQVWRMANFKFEINSPKQLGDVLFERMGLPSPGMTRGKNPQHKTGAEELEKLAKTHPICEFIISYRKVAKAGKTYFEKLNYLNSTGKPVRFSFNIYSAPTFRFAAPGGSPDKDGATGINIQAVSNGESRDLMGVNLSAKGIGINEYQLEAEESLVTPFLLMGRETTDAEKFSTTLTDEARDKLPWIADDEDGNKICFREICIGCPASCKDAGIDVVRRLQKSVKIIPSVRQSFQAPEGWSMVSFDYDRQELVIGANLSKEPKWIAALGSGEDLHAVTAANAFGMPMDRFMAQPKHTIKKQRDAGKVLNFATFYGATAYTLARKADISKASAEAIFEGFKKGFPILFTWIDKVHIFSRKNGYTTTFFGRKRYLREFYAHKDKKMHEFGDRSAVNTAIQGTGAEVTRIAMVKVDKGLRDAGYGRDKVRMVMQLHDELSFLVRDDMLDEIIPVIKSLMEFKVKSWEVQLSVSAKAGRVWGKQKEWAVT